MAGQFEENAVSFACEDDAAIGIVASPVSPAERGVLIVVGGPQYRVGSHRQFVLLSRHLAAHGIATMRFDVRGMGDSSGTLRSFEDVQPDLAAAVDCFFAKVQQLKEVVLWGLCDAASAALFYAHRDRRVCGLVLLNPWVRTSTGEAQAYLRHYYRQRLLSAELWRKLIAGRFDVRASVASLAGYARKAFAHAARTREEGTDRSAPLPERMADGMQRFSGEVLLILSGNDLTAREFTDTAAASPRWRALLADARVTQRTLAEANHTFSTRAWRDCVADWTLEWVTSR